jgi:hypothetical protein
VMPRMEESLLAKCPELKIADNDTLREILTTHVVNMGKARTCKEMHDALVSEIRRLQK